MKWQTPSTRLEAAKCLRKGQRLEVNIKAVSTVNVLVQWETRYKVTRARLITGAGVLWLVLNWKQTLGFIRRNYSRKTVK